MWNYFMLNFFHNCFLNGSVYLKVLVHDYLIPTLQQMTKQHIEYTQCFEKSCLKKLNRKHHDNEHNVVIMQLQEKIDIQSHSFKEKHNHFVRTCYKATISKSRTCTITNLCGSYASSNNNKPYINTLNKSCKLNNY